MVSSILSSIPSFPSWLKLTKRSNKWKSTYIPTPTFRKASRTLVSPSPNPQAITLWIPLTKKEKTHQRVLTTRSLLCLSRNPSSALRSRSSEFPRCRYPYTSGELEDSSNPCSPKPRWHPALGTRCWCNESVQPPAQCTGWRRLGDS